MKNVFLTLAFMLVGMFAFAEDVKEPLSTDNESTISILLSLESDNDEGLQFLDRFDFFGTCYVTIGFYDADGNKVASRTLQFNNVRDKEQCSDIADKVAEVLAQY